MTFFDFQTVAFPLKSNGRDLGYCSYVFEIENGAMGSKFAEEESKTANNLGVAISGSFQAWCPRIE
jgi:hypothetical protein